MLQALELVGFKSFADRTRFDFPPGITVVVGPNGSGKSNIVDAIKWVLGEQSAKSLRGKEMSDVIFKGAGTGRKPSNTAEATIIFDNSSGLLPLDSPEVHVTRRVYRSGEGEYLLNRQACRLKDVKDLFRGTGVGTDAYSLIEQGKVDTLLQASAKDRRAIFEEAAGISRFKAKKVEAQRRLERVEQNLLRLADIVEEVESRLKSIRAQATKAQRYREYTDRLQALRTQVARVDWKRLTGQLRDAQQEMRERGEEADRLSSRQESLEARMLEVETETVLVDDSLRASEAQVAQTTERIRALESTTERERERVESAARQCSRYRRQLLSMSTRAVDVVSELSETRDELQRAEREHESALTTLKAANERAETLAQAHQQWRVRQTAIHQQQAARLREKSELEHQLTGDQAQLKSLEAAAAKVAETLADMIRTHTSATERLEQLQRQAVTLVEGLSRQEQELTDAQAELKTTRNRLAQTQRSRSKRQGERSGCLEQIKILEELESRLEGVDAGVKRVLQLKRDASQQPFAAVRGLIAELISVDVEFAPLVDVALGQQAQCLVFAGSTLVEYLKRGDYDLPGRVSFLGLESAIPLDHTYHVDISGQTGVIGRADTFVEVPREYRLLIRRLLGTTWFVESLDDALGLIHGLGQGLRYVTRKGELLDIDERLQVGPQQKNVGLVSRRSQLRSLQGRATVLAAEIAEMREAERTLTAAAEQCEERADQLGLMHQAAAAKVSQQNANIEAAQQRLQEVTALRAKAQSDTDRQSRERSEMQARLDQARRELKKLEHWLSENATSLRDVEHTLQRLEDQQRDAVEVCTTARVDQAKKEQRLEGLQTHIAQLQRDQEQREASRREAQRNLQEWTATLVASELEILQATSHIAEFYLQVENAAAIRFDFHHQRHRLEHLRKQLSAQVAETRAELRSVEERQHRLQLLASQARQERDNLAQRMHDDYQIDMEQQLDAASEMAKDAERAGVEDEIEDLRRKISNIGPVNLEALNELDEIESRHQVLAGQYRDLIEAKDSLARIIQKINKDSRRLFKETLDAIRVHFQEMFRKVFGGGRADIILEEGVDILDAGIDIVATPPGKQSLGLSLLSGGERALTAVTLLLAIFKYRPSPFCVLDEVDGPLDESNVGRFIEVLQSFLETTKFVIVTHSKKTMTAATTLYGVTMQEAGVSKRVAVQFEDVSEDGQIREQSDAGDGDDERGAA